MKKYFVVLLNLMLIVGCSQKNNNVEPRISQQPVFTAEPTAEPTKTPEAAPSAPARSGYKTESLFNGSFKYSIKDPLPECIVVENEETEYGIAINLSYERSDSSLELITTYYIQDNLNGYSSEGLPMERSESEAIIKKDGYYVFVYPGNPYDEGIDFSQYKDVIVFE